MGFNSGFKGLNTTWCTQCNWYVSKVQSQTVDVTCINRYCSCYTGCEINWHGERIGQKDDGTINLLSSTIQKHVVGITVAEYLLKYIWKI